MNLEQLIKIAEAGFPDCVKKRINFNECVMHAWGSTYKLINRTHSDFLVIYTDCESYVQITTGVLAFNQYAAIEKMKELKLIKT